MIDISAEVPTMMKILVIGLIPVSSATYFWFSIDESICHVMITNFDTSLLLGFVWVSFSEWSLPLIIPGIVTIGFHL